MPHDTPCVPRWCPRRLEPLIWARPGSAVDAAGAGWRWLALAGAGWRWLALAGAGWRWLALAGAGWCCQAQSALNRHC
jgi:hypothetical protein